MNIHTYLVDNDLFNWIKALKIVKLNDVMGVYQGKTYIGKEHSKYTYIIEKKEFVVKFYRIDDHYIIPNYPKQ